MQLGHQPKQASLVTLPGLQVLGRPPQARSKSLGAGPYCLQQIGTNAGKKEVRQTVKWGAATAAYQVRISLWNPM
jgi:hypothetical protein